MYRYIVIDDEKFTRIGTIAKLEPMSDQLVCAGEASNGELGLSLIEKIHPDIVITDMKMPVLGGEQLLPIIAEKYPDIYIIEMCIRDSPIAKSFRCSCSLDSLAVIISIG